jgi:hypothetical protein
MPCRALRALRELGFVSLALIVLCSIIVILAAPAVVLLRGSPHSAELRQALADHARTTAELRASSAKLRANCIGPKWQRMPYRSETT